MRRLCRLCIKPCDKTMQKVDEVMSEVINIVLVNVNLKTTEEPSMCANCTAMIRKCFDFKSTCFYTEDFIFPYINTDDNLDMKLDLKELYILKQNLTELMLNNYQKICRFCLELTDELFISLCDVQEGMLQKCIPELVSYLQVCFVSTIDPAICKRCHDCLKDYTSFVDSCAQTEEKINKYRRSEGTNKRGLVAMTKVQRFINKEDQCVAQVEIKPEKIHYAEYFVKEENYLENGKMEYKDMKNRTMKYHYTEEEIKTRIYTCDACPYRSSLRKTLKRHSLIHLDPSQKEMFSCEKCTYQTSSRHHLVRHMNNHSKDRTKVVVFKKCPKCDYRAKFASMLKTHMRTHEDIANVRTYDCEKCTFRSRYKVSLTSHMRKHDKTWSFRCDKCPFKTRYVESFKRHAILHQDASELTMFRCAQCDFQAIRKCQLNMHITRCHTDPSLATIYKCSECPFTTFYKCDHKRHLLRHKDRSEVTLFKCKSCSYESIYKKNVRKHEVVHQNRHVYKCKICPYKTKRKSDLGSHMVRHVDPSKLERLECAICRQTFKMKFNLRKHIMQQHINKT